MDETKLMWTTKGVLATGTIRQVRVEVESDGYAFPLDGLRGTVLKVGRDVFADERMCRAAACGLRDRKVDQLVRQVAKLKAFGFEGVPHSG